MACVSKGIKCEGAGLPPKIVTMQSRGNFSGYGICSKCNTECALTKTGKMHPHKVR